MQATSEVASPKNDIIEDAQAAGYTWLEKFGPGNLLVEKVWAQNIDKVEEELRKMI